MKYISTPLAKSKAFITTKVWPYAKAHKTITAIALIAVLGGGYAGAKAVFGNESETQYALARVTKGNIETTVTGTGQVAATNKIDLKAKVSGTITSVNAKAGQTMKAGQVIARIDTTDIAISLQTARLSLQKLTSIDQSSVTQSQNSLTGAQESKIKSLEDAKVTLATTYLDIPDIIESMDDLFYDESGFLSDRNRSSALNTNGNVRAYRDEAGMAFDAAKVSFASAQKTYAANTTATDQAKIVSMLDETYAAVSKLSDALKKAKIAVDKAKDSLSLGVNTTSATTAQSNVSAWTTKVNGKMSDLLSAKNGIASADRTIAERQNSLNDTVAGADALDIRSQELNIRQKEIELAKYTIRAPFDGVLASLNIKRGDDAGSASIGTFITEKMYAEITLNEIDAANVIVGQSATVSFDALEGVTATGTVANIDLVGTVTQGVVNYTAQIAFDIEDPRIKPGMSVTATVTTSSKKDVLVVPSTAVKTEGGRSYVEVAQFGNGTSTMQGGMNRMRNATSTGTSTNRMMNATSTIRRTQNPGGFGTQGAVTLPTPPTRVFVETGATNDTQTEIISGLTEGQFVVSRTISGTSTPATTRTTGGNALFGGNRAVGGGTTRAFTGGGQR